MSQEWGPQSQQAKADPLRAVAPQILCTLASCTLIVPRSTLCQQLMDQVLPKQ